MWNQCCFIGYKISETSSQPFSIMYGGRCKKNHLNLSVLHIFVFQDRPKREAQNMFKKVLTFVLTKKDKNGIGRINIILGPFSICLVYPWYFLPALYNSLFNQSAPKTINWVPPDIFAYPRGSSTPSWETAHLDYPNAWLSKGHCKKIKGLKAKKQKTDKKEPYSKVCMA